MDFPSRLDLQAIGRDYVRQRGTRVDPQVVDILGSDANIFVGVSAGLAYAIVIQLAFAVSRLLLDGAEGEDLDRYAWDRYQLVRKGASSALVPLRMYRAAAGVGGSIDIGTVVTTATNTGYVTLQTGTFLPGSVLVNVTARAVQAGKATQVGANTLRRFQTAVFDPNIQVNNDVKAAGGEDAEDDGTFRERIRAFWKTARRGVLAAIEFGATLVPGVVSAQAVEALDGGGRPARVVNLYIADSSGVANVALANAVDTQLFDYRAAGIAVVTLPSLPTIVTVVLHLTFSANVDNATLGELVRSAVVEYINSLPVNATLTLTALGAVLERYRSDGLIPGTGSIVTPAGDIVPDPGQSLRTTLDNVTLS